MDAVPIRPFWLDQFIVEVLDYPRAAVRGSPYRGWGGKPQPSGGLEKHLRRSMSRSIIKRMR